MNETRRLPSFCAETVPTFRGTISSLIACYQADPISPYRMKIRHATRVHYDTLCKRLRQDVGTVAIPDIRARTLLEWHTRWSVGGKVQMAHALIGMLRTLVRFGLTMLEDDDCAKLSAVLGASKFEMGKPRTVHLTAEQANLIRKKAHEVGRPSIALAQAFQFECMLRQKDIIGEWVPRGEPVQAVIDHAAHGLWLRGILWEEIDDALVLRHVTSKRQKRIEVPIFAAPMICSEMKKQFGGFENRPLSGPIVLDEMKGIPYAAHEFRRQWRKIARLCGIPDEIRNMDSRSGAISEATDAGVDLEHVRHAATHSDIKMTMKYSRNSAEKVANVMRQRAQHRAAEPEEMLLLPAPKAVNAI